MYKLPELSESYVKKAFEEILGPIYNSNQKMDNLHPPQAANIAQVPFGPTEKVPICDSQMPSPTYTALQPVKEKYYAPQTQTQQAPSGSGCYNSAYNYPPDHTYVKTNEFDTAPIESMQNFIKNE